MGAVVKTGGTGRTGGTAGTGRGPFHIPAGN